MTCRRTSLLAYDADQNGMLSEEELQIAREHRKERRQQTQALWDTNNDGELQDEEIQHAHEIILHEILASRLDHFESVDLSADGKLDYQEFLQIPGMDSRPEKEVELTFNYIDKNEDGMITEEEFLEAFVPPEPDGPKEGTSADELSQMLRKSFTEDFGRMDLDSSGDLTLEEFLKGNPAGACKCWGRSPNCSRTTSTIVTRMEAGPFHSKNTSHWCCRRARWIRSCLTIATGTDSSREAKLPSSF